MVSISPESRASFAAHFGLSLAAAHGKLVTLFRTVLGADRVLDMQLAHRVAALESRIEMAHHLEACEREGKVRPLLASSCPGWICFAEKSNPEALPFVSAVRSPQQIMGRIVKQRVAAEARVAAAQVYHVCVMMCYDKKLEATRDDFVEDGVRDVDTVLASSELLTLLGEKGVKFAELQESGDPSERLDLRGNPEGSGAQASDMYRHVALSRYGMRVDAVPYKVGRNPDVREAVLEVGGKVVLKVAVANGFRNIQNIVRKLKTTDLHYVEIMACPSGCLNGGGQIRAENAADREASKAKLKSVTSVFATVSPDCDDFEESLLPFYRTFVGGAPGSEEAKKLFYTQYHAVPPMESSLAVNW